MKTPAVVPYITARTGEEPAPLSHLLARPGHGLAYPDETDGDRDAHGVLWARTSQPRDGDRLVGRPRWRDVHPARQRECMEGLLCQVCALPASRTEAGYLFLASPPNGNPLARWPEGHLTSQPPLCLRHAQTSVDQCGYLARTGAVALRAKEPRPYGVLGTVYGPGPGGRPQAIRSDDPAGYLVHPYRHRHVTAWLLASQLVCRLRAVTVIDLPEEIAADAARTSAEPE
ncbi:hypothetical protein IAG44_39760 [Streptomyces roseirectus]|uniref:Uncharacterized protein n=1 Tax=Streptomyces roseirectus TaxID=2768066 RepID=A0A7H0IQ88_9ACTN|nr:hypothetical protein [Streptomyces roseirectus]QNP74954.1 hypothetical protein IAG44_39760 [Streptomyces roseirectus]